MFKNIKGVFFDLDGTLIDSMWMWKDIDIAYLRKFNIEIPDRLQKNIEGMSFNETAVYFKERFNIPDSLSKIKSDWNEMALEIYETKVPLKNNAYRFLNILKSKDIKMCIATSNSRELTKAVLKALNIEDYFQFVLTGSDVEKGKPDPFVYNECARAVGLKPEECLVLEDVVNGIKAGKNAGMTVCGVDDEFSADTRYKKIEMTDFYIYDYAEIIECFENIK